MEEPLRTLKRVSIFSSLDENTLKDILRIGRRKKFEKGKTICQEGEHGDSMYIVLSGKVRVSLFHEGKEHILATIEKGGFFGELSLIDGFPRSANVETDEDSEFLIIQRQDFLRLMKKNPEVSIEIMKTLSKRLRSADERIRDLVFLPVERRVLGYLLDFAEKNGSRIKNYLIIEKGPTNNEISSFCGCARETVSRAIKMLERKGIIKRVKHRYVIYPSGQVV